MKFKKILTLSMSLAVAVGAVACTKKTETKTETKVTPAPGQEKTAVDNVYLEQYSKSYEDYIAGLNNYQMYSTPEKITEYYKTNKYPGNEAHLENMKTAYKESKTKIQAFIDALKKDTKTDDAELKKMNEDLIAEGEKTIKNIDYKIKKLDEIPKEDVNKSQEEFLKIVDDATIIKDNTKSSFSKMIDEMNKKLGITPNK